MQKALHGKLLAHHCMVRAYIVRAINHLFTRLSYLAVQTHTPYNKKNTRENNNTYEDRIFEKLYIICLSYEVASGR